MSEDISGSDTPTSESSAEDDVSSRTCAQHGGVSLDPGDPVVQRPHVGIHGNAPPQILRADLGAGGKGSKGSMPVDPSGPCVPFLVVASPKTQLNIACTTGGDRDGDGSNANQEGSKGETRSRSRMGGRPESSKLLHEAVHLAETAMGGSIGSMESIGSIGSIGCCSGEEAHARVFLRSKLPPLSVSGKRLAPLEFRPWANFAVLSPSTADSESRQPKNMAEGVGLVYFKR